MRKIIVTFAALLALASASRAQDCDLWICSGQSNMELPVSRCLDAVAAEVADYACPEISYLKVPLAYNFDWPQKALPAAEWETLDSPQTAQSWGALCYFVARYLHESTGRPVKVLNSSVGGSPIEAWLPAEELPSYAREELRQIRDPRWMERTLYHNAHLYSDWQNAHNALPDDPDAVWSPLDDMFSDWGLEAGEPVYGSHLLRRTFTLKASQTKGDAVLHLGAMRDADSTFVNGHFVGNVTYQYPPRNYSVPAEYLQKGNNTVEIHLYAAENAPAFVPDKEYSLETVKGKVPLTSGWEYKPGRRMPRRDSQVFLQYKPAGLYNAMIAPLKGLKPKGVIWYQGESNAGSPEGYGEMLETLIRSWRDLFDDPDLPFYIVELAAYQHSENETAATSGWVRLQDIQREVCERMDGVYLVPNRDLGEWNDIHPQDKATLGRRTVDAILSSEQ